jgi:hypothetical protein
METRKGQHRSMKDDYQRASKDDVECWVQL